MAGRFENDEVGRLPVEKFGHCLNLGTACNMPAVAEENKE